MADRAPWNVAQVGTYRARDGALVHIHRDADGDVVLETEREHGRLLIIEIPSLVKLSDDPYWPDLGPVHPSLLCD